MASTFSLASPRLVIVSRKDRRLDPQEKPERNPISGFCCRGWNLIIDTGFRKILVDFVDFVNFDF